MSTHDYNDYLDAIDKIKRQRKAVTPERIEKIMGGEATQGSIKQVMSQFHREARVMDPNNVGWAAPTATAA